MNDEIREILDKLKDGNWYDELDLTGTMWIELRWEETHLLLDYITNLQQDNEMYAQLKDEYEEEIKEANDNAEWWHNRFNAVQRDNEDNLRCIKSLKEQLESVIKNNQELLEKWHKNNDKIVNLISENERLKELCDEYEEEHSNEFKIWKEERHELLDYKSRCEKASECIKKDTRWFDSEYASIYGELCDCAGAKGDRLEVMVNPSNALNILQNGSDSQ